MVNDDFDKVLLRDLLKIKFDVKFNEPKTQEEVKSWVDKYFDYVEGSFNAKPIAERPKPICDDDDDDDGRPIVF